MSERGPPHRSRRGRKNSSDGKVDLSHSTKRGRVQKLESIRHRNTAISSSPAPPTIRYSHLAGASSDPQMSVDMFSFRHHAQYNQHSGVQKAVSTASELPALASSPASAEFKASAFPTTPPPLITPSSIQTSDGNLRLNHQVGNEFDYDAEASRVYQDIFSDVGAATRMLPVAMEDNQNYGPHPPGCLPGAAQTYSSHQMEELGSLKASVGAGLLAFPARVWKSFHAELNPMFVDAVIHPSCLKKLHLAPKAIPHTRRIPPISSPIGDIHPTRFVKIAVQLSEPEVTAKTVTALVLPDQFPYYGGVCLWLGSKYIDEAHLRDWLQNYHVQHKKAVLSRQAAFTLSFGELFADDPFYGSHHANIADDLNISQAFSLEHSDQRISSLVRPEFPTVTPGDLSTPFQADYISHSASSSSESATMSPVFFSPYSGNASLNQAFKSPRTSVSFDNECSPQYTTSPYKVTTASSFNPQASAF